MNTRAFLKSIPLLGSLLFLRKDKKDITNINLVEHPPAIDRRLAFELNGYKVNLFVTDRILINMPDGSIYLNVYGNFCKVVAEARKGTCPVDYHCARFEAPTIDKKELDKCWGKHVELIIAKVSQLQDYDTVYANDYGFPKVTNV